MVAWHYACGPQHLRQLSEAVFPSAIPKINVVSGRNFGGSSFNKAAFGLISPTVEHVAQRVPAI